MTQWDHQKLIDYINQHPKLTLSQAVASYLKLYPGRAIHIIVELLNLRQRDGTDTSKS